MEIRIHLIISLQIHCFQRKSEQYRLDTESLLIAPNFDCLFLSFFWNFSNFVSFKVSIK